MSRGMSFEPTKQERNAVLRRQRVHQTAMRLLAGKHSVSAQEVYLALDHTTPPPISPANSGNILALLAREGILTTIMGQRTDGTDRLKREKGEVFYTLPPRRFSTLPVAQEGGIVRPLTREELMVGKARPRRPRYVSMMDAPCVELPKIGNGDAALPSAGTSTQMSAQDNKNDAPLHLTHKDVRP